MSFCEPVISKNEEGDSGTAGQQVPILKGWTNHRIVRKDSSFVNDQGLPWFREFLTPFIGWAPEVWLNLSLASIGPLLYLANVWSACCVLGTENVVGNNCPCGYRLSPCGVLLHPWIISCAIIHFTNDRTGLGESLTHSHIILAVGLGFEPLCGSEPEMEFLLM